jgi:hypothetical protein
MICVAIVYFSIKRQVKQKVNSSHILNNDQKVQLCDATDDASSNAADYIIKTSSLQNHPLQVIPFFINNGCCFAGDSNWRFTQFHSLRTGMGGNIKR